MPRVNAAGSPVVGKILTTARDMHATVKTFAQTLWLSEYFCVPQAKFLGVFLP